jgi:hypothetical protein
MLDKFNVVHARIHHVQQHVLDHAHRLQRMPVSPYCVLSQAELVPNVLLRTKPDPNHIQGCDRSRHVVSGFTDDTEVEAKMKMYNDCFVKLTVVMDDMDRDVRAQRKGLTVVKKSVADHNASEDEDDAFVAAMEADDVEQEAQQALSRLQKYI